jgi:hypothetical protein
MPLPLQEVETKTKAGGQRKPRLTIGSLGEAMECRGYLMIYRGPGFLAVV